MSKQTTVKSPFFRQEKGAFFNNMNGVVNSTLIDTPRHWSF